MFQAWAVKIAKIAAHSAPSWLPGKRRMKKTTVKVRKPSTGTDCRISSAGTMTSSALRLLAAKVATTNVKTSEARMAPNMRKVVRKAQVLLWACSPETAPKPLQAEVAALRKELKLNPAVLKTRYPVPSAGTQRRFKEQLLRTNRDIGMIGEQVGWNDPNYFARRFRAHFGVSATKYRKQFEGSTADGSGSGA